MISIADPSGSSVPFIVTDSSNPSSGSVLNLPFDIFWIEIYFFIKVNPNIDAGELEEGFGTPIAELEHLHVQERDPALGLQRTQYHSWPLISYNRRVDQH